MQSRKFDLVWIEKEALPWFPVWIENLLLQDAPYVLDFDDAIFHNYDRHPSSLVRSIFGKRIDHLMARAQLVVVGNDYLADRARHAGAKRVAQLPSVVDINRYQPAFEREDRVFTIGWIGSPSTAKYLLLLEDTFAEVCSNFKSRVVLVGAGDLRLIGTPVNNRPWSEKNEVRDIQTFDVGIMPLTDDPWERGKCGFKLIQYMACGLPVIASPVGVNQQIVDHGVNGLLASTSEDWVRALTDLRDNHEKCAKMGGAARRKVVAEYSLQANAPRLIEMLLSVVKVPSR